MACLRKAELFWIKDRTNQFQRFVLTFLFIVHFFVWIYSLVQQIYHKIHISFDNLFLSHIKSMKFEIHLLLTKAYYSHLQKAGIYIKTNYLIIFEMVVPEDRTKLGTDNLGWINFETYLIQFCYRVPIELWSSPIAVNVSTTIECSSRWA